MVGNAESQYCIHFILPDPEEEAEHCDKRREKEAYEPGES